MGKEDWITFLIEFQSFPYFELQVHNFSDCSLALDCMSFLPLFAILSIKYLLLALETPDESF